MLAGFSALPLKKSFSAQLARVEKGAQTWQGLMASRAINTTYINTTGKTIMVSASVSGVVANSTLALAWTIGGVSSIGISVTTAGSTPANTTLAATALVPPGASYALLVTQGSLASWAELR
ncbi:hypothetical protein RD110_08135 [Rhodoferax koreense]|uniref:Uncharacterized protein n=1 Tax=Rhodoferax koreensis TaxID=1842727 RepID=A0A1P8JTU7_9BURK|nr:hypothetical protein [Rhodoferax koreense]APW37172.1 hypothetical protein RD110_08135 [Rhodoferax koreense]